MTTAEHPTKPVEWHALSPDGAAAELGVDIDQGLDASEVERRRAEFGLNELRTEPPPSVWVVARAQLANPMNIMLLIVAVASFGIGQIATGVVVTALVTFNVVMGSSQELKARASVEALAQLQVPHARVRRTGAIEELESTMLVPGDVVLVEAGDVVPADGRIITSATLEVQEAALTGESAPVAKDRGALVAGEDIALGDRTNLVFQNTQVTRGSATFVVTDTGSATQMGRIADMVTATQRTKSPLQQELDGMTKVFGILAWGAVVDHRPLWNCTRRGVRNAHAAVRFDCDFGHSYGPPDVRPDDARLGRSPACRGEGGGEVVDRRRDARRHDRHQQRQDRDAHDERDDRDEHARRRRVVPDRRRRLPKDGRHSRRRRQSDP